MSEVSEYNYKWWLGSSNKEKIEYLIKNEKNTDCTFVFKNDDSDVSTNEDKLKCHKWILMGASEVFQAMFNGNFKEKSNEIEIHDVKIGVFEKFLRFLYFTDYKELEMLDAFHLTGLGYLARKYMIKSLVENCNKIIEQKLITKKWSDEELVVIYRYARLNEDEDILKKWKEVIATYKPFTKTFPSAVYELDAKQMYEFLDALEGIATETQRFQMIVFYAKANDIKVRVLEESNNGANKEVNNKEVNNKEVNNREVTNKEVDNKKVDNKEVDAKKVDTKKVDTQNKKSAITANEKTSNESIDEVENFNEMYLKLMIRNIAFDKMSAREFCLGPGKSELLSDAEKVEGFINAFRRLCTSCSSCT